MKKSIKKKKMDLLGGNKKININKNKNDENMEEYFVNLIKSV